ncbi:MAG: acylneuraminate cytidylyltransferase family protein [Flavobacteriia bacterium]|nr:acylneuraminate cytidylyltransferase family protein [Flavobacteriia bacterium]
MKVVSLILARGGSKGIPGKNITKIKDRPLIDYAIKSSLFSRSHETWVSTDCEEIKKTALNSGAQVIDRPKEISQDNSQNEEALLHFAKHNNFDILISIQPTSPLILPQDIDNGISIVKNLDCDSCFSATEKHWIPHWDHQMNPIEWYPENRPFRQQKPISYEENGAFYITTRKALLKSKLRYSGRIMPSIIPLSRSFQVDSFEDLELIDSIIHGSNLYDIRNWNKSQRRSEDSKELDRYLKVRGL